MGVRHALNIHDLQQLARRRLPASIYGFVAGGTEDDHALRNNRAVFERIRFRPRGAVNVSVRSQSVEIFGRKFASPIGIAPMGITGVCWFEADLALARAAAKMNVPYTLSSHATMPMERVAQAGDGAKWLQAYLSDDRERVAKFVRRALDAGFEALMVTTDVPVPANRENNLRSGFSLPLRVTPRLVLDGVLHPRWAASVFARTLLTAGIPRLENTDLGTRPTILAQPNAGDRPRRDTLDWPFLRWLRDQWPRPLLIKGTLHPADATAAVACGLDGIVVSNHGGRQLEGAISPIEALPDIVAAAGERLTVIVDSGFRRGTDVLKALALGAKLVLCGRAVLFGAAAGGEAGALHALSLLRAEIDRDLALLGCPDIAGLGPEFLDVRDLTPTTRTHP